MSEFCSSIRMYSKVTQKKQRFGHSPRNSVTKEYLYPQGISMTFLMCNWETMKSVLTLWDVHLRHSFQSLLFLLAYFHFPFFFSLLFSVLFSMN